MISQPSVHLHIDELVLHGFDPADRHRIGDAVQRELARLLTPRGLRGGSMNVVVMDGGEFPTDFGARAEFIDAQIASAVRAALHHGN